MSGGEKNENYEEGGEGFKGHAGPLGKVSHQLRRTESYVAPGLLWQHSAQKISGSNRAGKLRRPIEHRVQSVQSFGSPVANGDCRIEVRAGYLGERREKRCDGQAVRQRDDEQIEVEASVYVLRGARCPFAKKYQGEGAEKFGGQFLRRMVHPEPSQARRHARKSRSGANVDFSC